MPIQLPLPGLALPDAAHPSPGMQRRAAPPAPHDGPAQPAPELLPPLIDYPDVPSALLAVHGKALGEAGEDLASSFLRRWGCGVFRGPEDLPYDRLIVLGTVGLRLQIKTRGVLADGALWFDLAHGYRGTPAGVRAYPRGAIDLVACVALAHNAVWFTADVAPRRHRILVRQIPALVADPAASFRQALADLGLAAPQPRARAQGSGRDPGRAAA